MWMVQKEEGLKYEIRNDIWKDSDTSVMDVKLKEGILRIVNVYNQAKRGEKVWCMKRWPKKIGSGIKMIVLGDFNAKGALWDTESEPVREDMVMDMAEGEKLVLLNETD
jgi:hypothetical protein